MSIRTSPYTRVAATLLIALAAALPPAQAAGARAPTAALAALAERYYEEQARLDPVGATLAGDNRYDDRLPIDIAPDQRALRFALYRRLQKQLDAIDAARLGDEDRLTRELLAYQLRNKLGFEPFRDDLMPIRPLDAMPIQLATFAGGQAEQPLNTPAQYDAYLKRLARLPAWNAQALVNMREGMRRGIVPPRPVVEAALAQLRPLGADKLADNPYYAPIARMPASFTPAERARLTAAYARVVQRQVAPSLRTLAAFVGGAYLEASRTSAGWGALPDGAAWYRQWVREQTTSDLDPAQIHAIGLREVERLQAELAEIAPKLGYDGDPRGLLAWVRTQDRFRPYRSEAQILDAYRAINTRVEASLPTLFGRRPKAPLEIRAEPELTRASASDHYALPAPDGSRPGIFWAVIEDPATFDSTTMVALFLHEGQPGHHFQMAQQQEATQLPTFRKRMWINAYGEGWALYAETLGREIGLYDDPAARVGALRLEMLRAARLVVDTGLHAQGWSREQAMAYWRDHVGQTETQTRIQIDRYMTWPAQALGYKLGALKIQELRERARAKLGGRFDIAAFHDAVLADGQLPLSVLDERIEAWIARRR